MGGEMSMTKMEFVCDICKGAVAAEYVLFDGEGSIVFTDGKGHKTIYSGMKRGPSSQGVETSRKERKERLQRTNRNLRNK